jgi:hypothetical protein
VSEALKSGVLRGPKKPHLVFSKGITFPPLLIFLKKKKGENKKQTVLYYASTPGREAPGGG